MIVRKTLRLEQLEHVGLHQTLHNVHVLHFLQRWHADNVADVDDVLVSEADENLDLAKRTLTVRLVFERRNLLDRHSFLLNRVERRTAKHQSRRKAASLLH